jgi:hypothetical protein
MKFFKYISSFIKNTCLTLVLLLTSSAIFATSAVTNSAPNSDAGSLKTLDKDSTKSQQQIKKAIDPNIDSTKEFEKLFKAKTDYLYVFSAEMAVIKYTGSNKYTLTITHPYPHVIYFSNQKNPQTGTLFTTAFLNRLMTGVEKKSATTQFRMRLYPGVSWNNQLAKPMQVVLYSITRQDAKTWVLHITALPKSTIIPGTYIYPDFYIFNSDLPKPLY